MGNSLNIKDDICFCNGPLVNNPNLQLIVTVLRQVKSQQSSCLFLTSLARFGSLDMHSCTAPMASLPPFHTHTCLEIVLTRHLEPLFHTLRL